LLILLKKDEVEKQLWENQISDLKHLMDLYSKIVFYTYLCPKFNLGFFMINFNGTIGAQDTNILTQNRAYGDAVFETVKIIDGKIFSGRLF
jgi:hypothetical protein